MPDPLSAFMRLPPRQTGYCVPVLRTASCPASMAGLITVRSTRAQHRGAALLFQLDILPGITVARRDGREHVLPLLRRDARANGIYEGVAKHRHKVVVLQNRPLDLLGQLLAFGGIERFQVLVELGVEFLHADAILGEEPTAFEIRLIPIGPACPDASDVENYLEP